MVKFIVRGQLQMPSQERRKADGFSLLELIITLAVLSILVASVVPLTKNNLKRQREYELKQNLREIRQAIDRYKIDCEKGAVGPLDRKVNDECYPPNLETLVEGITPPNTTRKLRYLRRMPRDPISGKEEWGFRSIQDDPKSDSWGGQNIYDVYSKSDETALNGTKYKDW
ncbi:MAG TPA: type II secretion system protein [Blastocatellia bacterium]|nr:type II secretion system protein [Blastocatellia bacterium]